MERGEHPKTDRIYIMACAIMFSSHGELFAKNKALIQQVVQRELEVTIFESTCKSRLGGTISRAKR